MDCHRSVALLISPYARRHYVDHTHYSTSSFVRTMEIALNLPSMTQFDFRATPLYRAFTAQSDDDAYACLPEQTDLYALNPSTGAGAKASLTLDFTGLDRADPDKLNAILWSSLKPGKPMPVPQRSFQGETTLK